jgi:MFS family permease
MSLDISKNSLSKYFIFGSLYIIEGIHIAIAWVLTPLYLLHLDTPPEIVTLVSGAIMVPWIGKFIFGYYIDQRSEKGRKPFILYGGLLSSITLLLVPIINPETLLIGFIILLILGQVGIGFLDLSADAWAITITKKQERGKLSGAMTIGLYLGMFLGSVVLTPFADSINFQAAYVLGGLLILPILANMLVIKEQVKKRKTSFNIKPLLIDLKRKNTMLYLLFLAIVSLNSGIISLTLPLYMDISLTLSVTIIGFISATFSISRALGSFILGALSDKYGRGPTIISILFLTIIFSISLIWATDQGILTIIYAIIGFLTGGLFSVIFAMSMDRTKKKVTALQFGIFMAFLNLGELSGGSISGTLISLLDFTKVFLYAAWIIGPAILLFYLVIITSKKKQKNK